MLGRFRKNRRPGNRPMTMAERLRVFDCKELVCIPCSVWAGSGAMPHDHIMLANEYDHSKSGNIRRGHEFGFASCQWHHRRIPLQGWSTRRMRAHFGPSLLDGSALFHDTYGSDDALIALQNAILSAVTGVPQEDAAPARAGIPQEEATQVPPDEATWVESP